MDKEKTIKIVITTERWLTKEEYKEYKKQCLLPVNWENITKQGFDIIKNHLENEEVKTEIQVIGNILENTKIILSKRKEMEETLKQVILPEEIKREEYDRVISYLITIGFFKNYI